MLSTMSWLAKILRGSSQRISKGQYHGKYEDDHHTIWEGPPTSEDHWSEFEKEELDRAIAIFLADEDEIGKKVIGKSRGCKVKICCWDLLQIVWMLLASFSLFFLGFILCNLVLVHKDKLTTLDEFTWSVCVCVSKHLVVSDHDAQLEEDEQLARVLQETWNSESPPQSPLPPPRPPSPQLPTHDTGSTFPPYSFYFPSSFRICPGCNSEVGHGRYLSCMGAVWHPVCFRCHACNQPISDYEFSMLDNRPYHKSCFKDLHHPKCDVCKNFIPTNSAGHIEFKEHQFWCQKYCPAHVHDGTPRCCSCERMEQVDARFLILDDGRKLCLECLDSSIMDTHECQPLYLEIQEFYEGLMMKIEQQIPMLLVERQALNEAMEGEKNGHHHMPETRGLCLSEEQTVSTILRQPTIGEFQILDMFTEPYRLVGQCEVTAILVLYGLPRLLTGSILAHEMMHAWLRLNGYSNLSPEVEEGICQVLAHMWLESEIGAGSGSNVASTSSSSSSSPPASSSSTQPGPSKKGQRSEFEKKLGEFFKHQIESDTSPAYGDGFKEGNKAVLKYDLRRTLDHIKHTGAFPC